MADPAPLQITPELAAQAAAQWGLNDPQPVLIAQRENTVFRVQDGGTQYALRFHRPGYRSTDELTAELDWTAELARHGLAVPAPCRARSGRWIEEIGDTGIGDTGIGDTGGGVQVDLLSWMPGSALGKAGQLEGIADRAGFCRALGATMARLHQISDAWTLPEGFTRPHWDRAGLVGPDPLWGRFWEHPDLNADERALLIAARDGAEARLRALEPDADYGLIHADLISENMLWQGGEIGVIDFDDGGFGHREFELATFLLRFRTAPDYDTLRAALLGGYALRRAVDPQRLDLFILLRALTYPGWIMTRLGEPGAQERSDRAVRTAVTLARMWLDQEGGA